MADHEDYLPGETPSPHKTTHQDGGADEISVAGLLGVTAELAAHALIATAHQDAPGLIAAHALIAAAHHARYTDVEAEAIADAQIAIHAAVVDAHHAKYTDAEARAAINNIFGADGKADVDIDFDTHRLKNISNPVGLQDADTFFSRDLALVTHAGLATVHQNAPALIETHRLWAAAHHVKFTAAEARAAINNIFGADGKADADVDLDTHNITGAGVFVGSNLYYNIYSIADDDFLSLTPLIDSGIIILSPRHINYREANCIVSYRSSGSVYTDMIAQSHTRVEVTTGALDGTTGNDGKVTLSTHTDGKIYIENRYGWTIGIGISFLGH